MNLRSIKLFIIIIIIIIIIFIIIFVVIYTQWTSNSPFAKDPPTQHRINVKTEV